MTPSEKRSASRKATEEAAQQQAAVIEEAAAQQAAPTGKLKVRLRPFEKEEGADAVEGDLVVMHADLENDQRDRDLYAYTFDWDTPFPIRGKRDADTVELDTTDQTLRTAPVTLTVTEWIRISEQKGEVKAQALDSGEDIENPGHLDDGDYDDGDYLGVKTLPPIAGGGVSGPAGFVLTGRFARSSRMLRLRPRPIGHGDVVPVSLRRTEIPETADQALWSTIRNSALTWQRYSRFMDIVMCGADPVGREGRELHIGDARDRRDIVKHNLRLPFPDVDAYRQLKVATEVFMMVNCGVIPNFRQLPPDELAAETRRYSRAVQAGDIERRWNELLSQGQRISGDVPMLPYLALVRRKLKDVQVVDLRKASGVADPKRLLQPEEAAVECYDILMDKLTNPCLLELIWSYWHEEGMLVQSMNAISWRFQNRRGHGDRDPLAMLEIDPLRPLNNFLWGYIQDEEHRLTVRRRAYEYDHHYGITLLGKAVPAVRGADSRLRFLEAFHHLLHVCGIFFKEDDDTTVVADAFPVLNALKEVHLLLTQGAHNQYGDLPWTARQEMLMQQWVLARPEFREFLPRRIMVDYPEEWMDSVETMKTLQEWSSASIMHFRDLGVFGEQILLGVRFGAWPGVIESEQAGNWARYWRPEIQGYIHGYRAVTGVDLSERVDATMPSTLLAQRFARRAPAQLPRGATRPLPQPAPVVQVPVPSDLQEWGQNR
jgi:hypothetical protein